MKRRKRLTVFFSLLLILLLFAGCGRLEDLKVKYGFKNTDF